MMRELSWEAGRWTNPPASAGVVEEGGRPALRVEPVEGADLWRTTSYGFVRDDAPALLAELPEGTAMEVDFMLRGSEQFDQAGILVRADAERWIKTGVEFADGHLQLGAVVTDGVSDWSTGQVSSWVGRPVSVRVSRSGDALTVRARVEQEPWRLVRLAPIDPAASWQAGPFCCSPSRAGLHVDFLSWRVSDADGALH